MAGSGNLRSTRSSEYKLLDFCKTLWGRVGQSCARSRQAALRFTITSMSCA